MSGKFPRSSDFSSSLYLTISPPRSNDRPVNILILLHGFGDDDKSFTELGRQLSLPETACISLRAPTPLPLDIGGYHWGDDIIFDQVTGKMEFDTGFTKATRIIMQEVIQTGLIENCGYRPRDIMLFGLGQGAIAALAAARAIGDELGGIISIGGPMPMRANEQATAPIVKASTPVLVVGGRSDTLITTTVLAKLKSSFKTVQIARFDRPDDTMPANREEMLPIMQFLARRLKSMKGIPKDSVPIG